MGTKCSCECGTAPTLIFSCSGAADVGEMADQAARSLTREGKGKMFCLAGIGGRVSGIMKTTEAAAKILAIDGCPLNCARKSLEEAGFKDFIHLGLADMGLKKGETTLDQTSLERVIDEATRLLKQEK
ncbi:putative zinc-binding protein [Desulfovibrio ferrophilus]|uniref:DGC domain-containing protein n=1 Tax=Desulfovibrio ferrophilus TaxID=241368 RepID=A0A2Z6B341_9BACT|nr:putative zinc-binding protein [Desulfovibrio ferrophilus]BBD09883.1 DGC domain-containing protein [Desulfovibrio ferrophilus]